MFLKISQNSQENTCARVSFLIKLRTLGSAQVTMAQVFSCEFFEISKNTFFLQNTFGGCFWKEPMLILLPTFHSVLNQELRLNADLQTIIKVPRNCYWKQVSLKLWNTEAIFLNYWLIKLQSIKKVNEYFTRKITYLLLREDLEKGS